MQRKISSKMRTKTAAPDAAKWGEDLRQQQQLSSSRARRLNLNAQKPFKVLYKLIIY